MGMMHAGSMGIMHVVSETNEPVLPPAGAKRQRKASWSKRKNSSASTLTLASTYSKRSSVVPKEGSIANSSISEPADTDKKDSTLMQFHDFLAEQQIAAGTSTSQAKKNAREAMGCAAPRSKLSRLGARFADAILHTSY